MKGKKIKEIVRESYKGIAMAKRQNFCGCGCGPSSPIEISTKLGYSKEELAALPEGANLGLGCGNPLALASLKGGETVVDLGSGAGVDCFIAASLVGDSGRVIGIDMTPEMVERARSNAEKGGHSNVEFRLGEIEALPLKDNTADLLISNCVINLVPDKEKAFSEAFRVLKPGGRIMVSDIVLEGELPASIKGSSDAYVGCISGAILKEDYLKAVHLAGFADIEVLQESRFPIDCMSNDPGMKTLQEEHGVSPEQLAEVSVLSVKVSAVKNH